MRARTMCKSGAVGLATGAVVLTLAAPGGAADTDFGDGQSGHGFGRMGPPNARTTSVSPSSGADFEMPFKCGQAWTGMTATSPLARGRGLARLVKAHALQAMAAGGIRQVATGNDDANAAMLAVNLRLGYAPLATVWSVALPL